MMKILMLSALATITIITSAVVQASKSTSVAGVVPPVGSTCESDKSGTEQHCTFPDGSKWICNNDLTKCHRKQKGTPSTSLPAVRPSGVMSENPGRENPTIPNTLPMKEIK